MKLKPRLSKFTMLLSESERRMLKELAGEYGMSLAMYLRLIIRVERKKLVK